MQQGSLTSKILGLMLLLILVSSSLATFAIINLSYSLGDANAINASGSLRMQSYRLMLYANAGSEASNDKVVEFENTLYSEQLKRMLTWPSPDNIATQYQVVIDKWLVMKYYIEQENSRDYAAALSDFVASIDKLVLAIEHFADFKLKLLVASQIFGLGLMLLITFIAVRFTKKKVVIPLHRLMESANTISKGNFEIEMPETEYTELTALTNALQKTAKELAALYGNLESQVAEKTLALTRANNELTFLYNTLLALNANKLDYKALKSALNQLKNYESLDYLRLVIEQTGLETEVIEADGHWPTQSLAHTQGSTRFPLHFEQVNLGYLELISPRQPNHALLSNFAIMITRSIVIHSASEQRQQLALMEERGVIARELHDSLGQVLSFLKIQVSLLRKSLSQTEQNQDIDTQLTEINEGVSTAYSQLRELLSTFRLTIKEPNLKSALEAMLEQLRTKTRISISLHYQLAPQWLEARQHIHILQITREATLNAIKHANAQRIEIHCFKDDQGRINISVSDDGIGIAFLQDKDQHFGLSIMRERASKLDGEMHFTNNAEATINKASTQAHLPQSAAQTRQNNVMLASNETLNDDATKPGTTKHDGSTNSTSAFRDTISPSAVSSVATHTGTKVTLIFPSQQEPSHG